MRTKRGILLGVAALTIVVVVFWALSGTMPGTLYFDSSGMAHGTGTRTYFYSSGGIKLEDRFIAGKLVEETWYKPDGSVLANEKFINGDGVGFYLRDDGSIRVKMTYVNGIAEGPATYFSTNGDVSQTVMFVGGQKVGGK
ncbi:MAG: hypothetical protein GXP29_07235 [Planctomycetes bacterium]|nr:hypothetical protein [Planctomycetota bacterium]